MKIKNCHNFIVFFVLCTNDYLRTQFIAKFKYRQKLETMAKLFVVLSTQMSIPGLVSVCGDRSAVYG